MFGGALTWYYNTLAGVNINESNPGYKNVIIKPILVKELENITYSKVTPYGKLSVDIRHKNFSGEITITIPVGSTASVYLPGIENPLTFAQGTHKIKF